jgi:hypothetical protein
MTKMTRLIIAGLLIVFAFFGESIMETVKDNLDDKENIVVNVVEPSEAWKMKVKNIVTLDITDEDARKISNFFSTFADVVKHDPGFIDNTEIVRKFNMTAGGLNFAGTEMKDKYPDLGELIDEAISSAIGLENVNLTEEKRMELVQCLRAIAWAVHQ